MTLCERGYYTDTIFHRLVRGFIIQGGDPTGTGTGGESAFGGQFRDEFDSRLLHDSRGVLSMANSGGNTNKSQFFITFAPSPHLDYKHCVFGRVVGGNATLDRMEQSDVDKSSVPINEIKILSCHVMVNPIAEADALLVDQIETIRGEKKKKALSTKTILGKRDGSQILGEPVPLEKGYRTNTDCGVLASMPEQSKSLLSSQSKTCQRSMANGTETVTNTRAPNSGAISQTHADKVAAFMRSQGAESAAMPAEVSKKKKIGGDFSSW